MGNVNKLPTVTQSQWDFLREVEKVLEEGEQRRQQRAEKRKAAMQPITDYASHLIRMEQMARQMHDLCLDKKYIEACDITQHMIAETRILAAVLALMHEQEVKRHDHPGSQ